MTTTDATDATPGTTPDLADVNTFGELLAATSDEVRISDPASLDAAITEGSLLLKSSLPQFRSAFTKGRTIAQENTAKVVRILTTRKGHPDWACSTAAYRSTNQAMWGAVAESMPAATRPTDEEIARVNAMVRAAWNRGVRDESIVSFVRETVNGMGDADAADETFKRHVRAEYVAAGLKVPKAWLAEGTTSDASASGGGAKPSDPADVRKAASRGIEGLGQVTPIYHAAALVTGIVELSERIAKGGAIEKRKDVSALLKSAETVIRETVHMLDEPNEWTEQDAETLAGLRKDAEKLLGKID